MTTKKNYYDVNATSTACGDTSFYGGVNPAPEHLTINVAETEIKRRAYFDELFENIEKQENELLDFFDKISLVCARLANTDLSFELSSDQKLGTVMERLHSHYLFKEEFCSALYNLHEFLSKTLFGEPANVEFNSEKLPYEKIICLKQYDELFMQQHVFITDIVELIGHLLSRLFSPEVEEPEVEKKANQRFLSVLIEGNEILLKGLNKLYTQINQIF